METKNCAKRRHPKCLWMVFNKHNRLTFNEILVEGKRLGEKDAYRVEKAIAQGWLKVKEVKNMFFTKVSLHPGENEQKTIKNNFRLF